MNKYSNRLISRLLAVIMVLQVLLPSIQVMAEGKDSIPNYTYNIAKLNKYENDEKSSISIDLATKVDNTNLENSIKFALGTSDKTKNISLILRENFKLVRNDHFDELGEAQKEFDLIKGKYREQGLDIDITLAKEGGKYVIKNNNEEKLNGYYKAVDFKVIDDFDFEKISSHKNNGYDRVFIFDVEIEPQNENGLNMVTVDEGDLKVENEGQLLAAIINDTSYTSYTTAMVEKDINKSREAKKGTNDSDESSMSNKPNLTDESSMSNNSNLKEENGEENILKLTPFNMRANEGFAKKHFRLTTKIVAKASSAWKIPRGWYFDVNVGPYLKEDTNNPIKDLSVGGQVVAKGAYDASQNRIRYTFIRDISMTRDISIDQILAFNTDKIGEKNNIDIDISVTPKNMITQKIPRITVSKDDPRNEITSQTVIGSESVLGSTTYPYKLSYKSEQSIRDKDGNKYTGLSSVPPLGLEQWFDIEVSL